MADWTSATKDDNQGFHTAFGDFLHTVEQMQFTTNTTSKGDITIQQTPRNELRRQGLQALIKDLVMLYGEDFDVVETKEGIVIVAENQPDGWTFSWELKSTIKSLNFDPFLEACHWDEDQAAKAVKKARRAQERADAEAAIQAKRAAKLALAEAKARKANEDK